MAVRITCEYLSNLRVLLSVSRASYFTTARIVMNNKTATLDETLAKNPFYEKYAAKITSLQQNDPLKLAEKLEELCSKHSRDSSESSEKCNQVSSSASLYGKVQGTKDSPVNYAQAPPKKLDSIMKTELLVDKSADEIKHLWHEYFKDKDTVSGVLPKKSFEDLNTKAHMYPTFLFALPRQEGYEFMLCQFAGNEAHFTTLINFQTHGENAPECLTLVYYPDLADAKDIVLMRGDYDKNTLNAQEAQCLVNQVMLYYVQPDEKKLKLVERFSKEPEKFEHMDLVRELENIKLF